MKLKKMALLITLFFMGVINASIEVTSGKYIVDKSDISVKIIGGYLIWEREYRNKNWYFNRAWEPLKFNFDSSSGLLESITKSNEIYKVLDSTATVFKNGKRRSIRKQIDDTYLWKDRDGHTTKYDVDGKVTSVQIQSGSEIKFIYNNDGMITGALDSNNFQVFWIDYDLITGQILKVRDYENREIVYTWEVIDTNATIKKYKLTNFKDLNGGDWTYEYSNSISNNGMVDLIKTTSPDNRIELVNYNSSGRAVSVADEIGNLKRYHFEYIKSKKEFYIKTTNQTGKVIETWFKRNGEMNRKDINGITLLSITRDLRKEIEKDVYGRVTTREYDEFNNLLKLTYPDGRSEEYTYDIANSKLKTYKNQNNIVTKYEYDNQGNLLRLIEAYGSDIERQTNYTYNQFGQVKSLSFDIGVASQTYLRQYFYDDFGNLIKEIDANGEESIYTYNVQGNRLTATNSRNFQWQYEYDNTGNLTEAISPNQFITTFEYNDLGLKTKTTNHNTAILINTYTKHGRPVTSGNELGAEYKNIYDLNGKILKNISYSGNETIYSYDLIGRLIKVMEASGEEIEFIYPQTTTNTINYGDFFSPLEIKHPTYTLHYKYDLRGRVIEESKHFLQNGQAYIEVVNKVYDGLDNVIEISGNFVKNQKFEYDGLNRVVKTYVNNELENQTGYDNRNLITSFKDANNREYKYEYDLNGNLTKEIRPQGDLNSYTYDANNNILSKTDATGNKIKYYYDNDDRKIKEEFLDSNQVIKKTVVYTLNNMGSIVQYDDGTSVGVMTYNLAEQPTSETVTIGGNSYSHTYTYYSSGLKQSFTGVDGISYSFFYNNNDQLQNLVVPNEGNISFSNFVSAVPQTVNYPNGIQKTLTYDGLQKTRSILVKDASNNIVQNHSYNYNNKGLLETKQTMLGSYQYQYDDKWRINSATYPTLPAENWSYDNAGNRVTDNITGNDLWTYDTNNQLTNSILNNYEYDGNGNITEVKDQDSNTLQSYKYNLSGQVQYLVDENGINIYEYYYDPFGKRLTKTNLANNETIFYHYSDEGLVYESGINGQDVNYLLSPGSSLETEQLLKKSNGEYFYYLNDHIGLPDKIIDNIGVIHSATEQSTFGLTNNYISVNNHKDNLRFPGQYFDEESGLNYNLQRYYNPAIGRYNQKDPLGVMQDYNEYAYALNNPLLYIDPYGEFTFNFYCKKIKIKGFFSAKTCGQIVVKREGKCTNVYLCFTGGLSLGGGQKKRKGKVNIRVKYKYPPPSPKPPPKPDGPKKDCDSDGARCSASGSGGTDGINGSIGCTAKYCRLLWSTCKQCYDCFDD